MPKDILKKQTYLDYQRICVEATLVMDISPIMINMGSSIRIIRVLNLIGSLKSKNLFSNIIALKVLYFRINELNYGRRIINFK